MSLEFLIGSIAVVVLASLAGMIVGAFDSKKHILKR